MPKFNYKVAVAVSFSFLLLALLCLLATIFKKDDIIIEAGIGAFRTLETLTYVFGAIFAVSLGLIAAKYYNEIKDEREDKEQEEIRKQDPLHDEAEVRADLEGLIDKLEDVTYLGYAKDILRQLELSEKLSIDFKEIVDDNDQPIIKSIAEELVSIRVHILQDAKSIYRRLAIAKDAETIEGKIQHNDKLLNDADSLIVEVINYIDLKTSTTEVDLKNLTESLKELIKMI